MFRKLLPQRDIFFNFFEEIALISSQSAQQLALFGSAGEKGNIFQKIRAFEHEGDLITHRCVEVLHKTFVTPMDRQDIYRLITTMDDVIDEMEDVARLFVVYRLNQFTNEATQLANILVAATQEMYGAVVELRKMKITPTIRNHFNKINQLENDADTLYTQTLGRLFDEEHDPKLLIKWKEVYDHLEESIDVCEDVSNILEGIILENE